ncbi:hypothetical protein HanHA300_Chr15g0570461 [Helianthus annuus]|nr:hypothetical protein HanHA300_Chr15g0570461 [Helianthus annuus]KAJ0473579.1 hypothetical protein HanHA89_Chr15g0619921 [Helianthus annuus]KAJ0649157.1 hypothetical protein HanLR1_Chr15g0581031 [Helianthus annuus]
MYAYIPRLGRGHLQLNKGEYPEHGHIKPQCLSYQAKRIKTGYLNFRHHSPKIQYPTKWLVSYPKPL